MKTQDFQTSITVDASTQQAFDAINNIAGWWTDSYEGSTGQLNDEFTVSFYDGVHVSTQKIVEFVPGKRIVWLVTDSALNFISDEQEWNNTKIVFELLPMGKQTRIDFTHVGLNADVECFGACSGAWHQYIQQSLLPLINEGKGNPTLKEEMMEKRTGAAK